MIEQWYYWHESEILGPFSGIELIDLATDGSILPDDIVWKDGVDGGVPAHTVKHLFAARAPAAIAGEAVSNTAPPEEEKPVEAPAPTVAPETPAKPYWEVMRAASGGKARAVAGKGTIVIGQDGITVKFRMKCTVCGFEDSSWKSKAITRGTTRLPFYCPKCRKKCNVEIHGHIG